jgi:hypothetical protein
VVLAAARIGVVALACLALIAIVPVLSGTDALRNSQRLAGQTDLSRALENARAAEKLQPYAASPRLQQALLLERGGDLSRARLAALAATRHAGRDWRPWLVVSRLEAMQGDAHASVRAYLHAKALNPRSPIFR